MYSLPKDKEFTKEQQEAIFKEGTNILVSAAAGCGKTTLMVERIIRKLIQDNIYINELVVVTFTAKAASELKERLIVELEKRKSNPHIFKQLSLVSSSYITTFHGLCKKLINENFYELNIDPNMTLLDELRSKIVTKDIFDNLDILKNVNFGLIEHHGDPFDNQKLYDMIIDIYYKALSMNSIEVFKNNTLKLYEINEFNNNEYVDKYLKNIKDEIHFALLVYDNFMVDLGEVKAAGTLENERIFLNKFLGFDNYYEFHQEFYKYKKPKLYGLPKVSVEDKNVDTKEVAYFKTVRDKLFEDLEKYLAFDEMFNLKIIQGSKNDVICVLDILESFEKEFKKYKKENNFFDYNDLEQYALKLLYNNGIESNVALKYQSFFNEIMIDEYQDTNEIQEKITSALSNKNNVFMVGDVKQAIYSFRNADPTLFIKKYNKYIKNDGGYLIELVFNFRSKKEVLEFSNYVFTNIMSQSIGGSNYNDKTKLYFKNESLDLKKGDFKTKVLNFHKDYDFLDARMERICQEIVKLHSEGVKYNEICLLFRSFKSEENAIKKCFLKYNIPFYIQSQNGYKDSLEVRLLFDLLSVINDYKDDHSLLGVLRSPLFNFNEDDFVYLKSKNYECYFEALDVEVQERIKSFSCFNNSFLDDVLEVLNKSNFLECIAVYKNYENRKINIETFLELLSDFEINSFQQLKLFFSKLDDNNLDLSEATSISSRDDVVNVMTMHKSKGLEFGYVFVFLKDSFNMMDLKKNYLVHNNQYLILPYFDDVNKTKYDNIYTQIAIKDINESIISEEMRILYVALTRAKFKLFIVSNFYEPSVKALNVLSIYDDKLPEYYVKKMKSHKEMLQIPLLRNFVYAKYINAHSEANDRIFNFKVNDDYLFDVEYVFDIVEESDVFSNNIIFNYEQYDFIETIKSYNYTYPSFEKSKGIEYGIKFHEIMAKFDFSKPIYDEFVSEIKTFLDFPLINNGSIFNQEFVFYDNSSKYIIDLLVDNKYVFDYKTDSSSMDEIKKLYFNQVKHYVDCVSVFYNVEASGFIYSTHHKEFIKIC